MKHFPLLVCLGLCVASPAIPAQELPQALARFQFDGNGNDSTGNKANRLYMDNFVSPDFRANALYGDGHFGGYPEQTPAIRTASLDYRAFTIAFRFKAMSFKNKNNNILSGGRYSRWISFCAGANFDSPSGNLTLTFNDQEYTHEYPVKLEVDRWYSLVCGVNLQAKTVTTWLDGEMLPPITLPRNFRLAVLEGDRGLVRKAREKSWYFSNYSTRKIFHGLIDELAVFENDVAAPVAEDFHVDPLMVKILLGKRSQEMPGNLIDENKNEANHLRREFDRIEKRLNDEGIQASIDGVIEYIRQFNDDEELERQLARLIQQLGDDSFAKREAASVQLRGLGSRARRALEEAKKSDDLEISWRASTSLKASYNQASIVLPINFALDYLRAKPSPKAVACLFTSIERDISAKQFARVCAALARCAQPENHDQIIKGLNSDNPRVRFAAIIASDRVFDSNAKKKFLVTYLSDDDELVRLAAASLLHGRSEVALKVLANLQSSQSFTTRYLVEQLIGCDVIDFASK